MKRLALFDFDGTITTHDTLFQVVQARKGKWPFIFILIGLSPILLLVKLKIFSAQSAKELLLKWAFSGMTQKHFESFCANYCANNLTHILRKLAMEKIHWHLNQLDEVVIVSASPENWIIPFASPLNIKVIATKLEIKQELISGKIIGKNCNGLEKLRRIQELYQLSEYDEIYAYGDSSGDLPMLSLANFKYYRSF